MTKHTFGSVVVQHKTGTAAQWASVNPTLAKGEFGIEIDTNLIKVGDGVTAWNSLSYINQGCSVSVGHTQQQYTLEPGYLALDGSTYSRTTCAALWAWAQSITGLVSASPNQYQFGTGDGSTTFTVPNHIGRVWQGAASIGQKEAALPNIRGEINFPSGDFNIVRAASGTSGALSTTQGTSMNFPSNRGQNVDNLTKIKFDASSSNSVYSDSATTVQPPAILLIPQIKY